MKVYFDHQVFSWQRFGGISRYFTNIYNSLHDHGHVDCKLLLLHSRNHYIKDHKFPVPTFLAQRFLKKQQTLEKWNKKYAEYMIEKNDFDILHPTYYNPYFLSKLKKPYVLTVYDMIHELFPEFFSPHDQSVPQKRETIMKADHIIAISESTKNDLQKLFNIPDHKISVVYLGYHENQETLTPEDHAFQPPFQEYILFVGERGGYKNFGRFVQAVTPLLHKYDINLVCSGGSLGVAEKELLFRAGIADRVKQVSATEAQLNMLYRNALALVFPSLYEGFGLPILEAFRNECPIVISNTSCFKEVGGDAASYFDPYQIEDMTQAIDAVINSKDVSNQLRSKGMQQLAKFPMDLCMERTLDVYRKLM